MCHVNCFICVCFYVYSPVFTKWVTHPPLFLHVILSLHLPLPSCGVATEHSVSRRINRAPSSLILHQFICPSPPKSLVLIRHVHIRGRGDAFMIIHPPSPPLIMAALDVHPLRTRHLALTLFGLAVCITTLFNGLFRGAEGVGCRRGQETF